MKKSYTLLFFVLLNICVVGQGQPDSTVQRIKQQLDTISFVEKSNEELVEKLLLELKGLSSSGENSYASYVYYSKLANQYYYSSKYHQSGVYYDSAVFYAGLNKDTLNQFKLSMNAGALKYMEGDYAAALTRYLNAVEYGNQCGYEDMGGLYSNIGMLYNSIDMLDKAQEYLVLALDHKERSQADSSSLIKTLNVLGMIARKKENYQESIELHEQAEEIGISTKSYLDLGDINHNLYEVYYRTGDTKNQLKYLLKSVAYYDSSNFRDKYYSEKGELAKYYLDNENYIRAGEVLKDIFSNYSNLNFESSDKQLLNEQYARFLYHSGEHQKAYKYLARAMAYKDTVHDQAQLNETANLELKLKMQQKERLDSIQLAAERKKQAIIAEKKEAEHEAELSSEKLMSTIGFGGGGFALVIALLLYRANRNKARANKIIREQKSEIEQKQHEIIDSIQYAKRLQNAIMPEGEAFKRVFPDSFVFYAPKDIVAGDFYFLEEVMESDAQLVYFAAVDCTGHGVPGAMLSVVGANGLKRCIREMQLREPGKILDELSKLVAENFTSAKEKIRDGMDIALCCLEIKGNEKRIHFSGAHNPVWIFNENRTSWPDELKPFRNECGAQALPTKQAVGYKEDNIPFKTISFDVVEGDHIYLFSDGYADQFGGDKGKKMKSAVFRRYLNEIKAHEMKDQRVLLRNKFDDWKGDLEQVDDVCVIGVRL